MSGENTGFWRAFSEAMRGLSPTLKYPVAVLMVVVLIIAVVSRLRPNERRCDGDINVPGASITNTGNSNQNKIVDCGDTTIVPGH